MFIGNIRFVFCRNKENKMRKAIVILLSFVMILAFAGCGSDSQSEDEQTQQAAAETTIQITMDISFPG